MFAFFVESIGFRVFIFIVILLNASTIGLHISRFNYLSESILFFEAFDNICLLIYIIEAALKLYAYGWNYFRSGWNIFDFSIIVLSLIPVLGVLPVPIQFLRIIRSIRVLRVLKVISLFNEMHVIVEAIGKSISGVVWTAFLLLIVIYVFDVIGVMRNGEVVVADPNTVRFSKGDALIVIEENDNPLSVLDYEAQVQSVGLARGVSGHPMRILVLGAYPITRSTMAEFGDYLAAGSTIVLADVGLDKYAQLIRRGADYLAKKRIALKARSVDIYDKISLDALLTSVEPDSVLVLSQSNPEDPSQEDRRIIELLLYLRSFRERASYEFSIACQINEEENRRLIEATGGDDYVAGRHLDALPMAQISQRREMSYLYESLLSSEGFEVYMKKAGYYLPLDVDLDLFSVGAAVAKRGEIFIGVRQMVDGRYQEPIVNPAKFNRGKASTLKKYRFAENDLVVVLAEDVGFKS